MIGIYVYSVYNEKTMTKKDIAPHLLKTAGLFGGKAMEYITEKAFGKHLLELQWILANCSGS